MDVKGTLTVDGNTAWHAGNQGPGSGLNADLLDGKHANEIFSGSSFNISQISDLSAFYVTPTSTQSVTANVNTKIGLQSVTINRGLLWDTVTQRFIADFSGAYYFDATVSVASNSTGYIMLFKNGVELLRLYTLSNNGQTYSGSAIALANPGDYFELYINMGASRTTTLTGTRFCGYRVY